MICSSYSEISDILECDSLGESLPVNLLLLPRMFEWASGMGILNLLNFRTLLALSIFLNSIILFISIIIMLCLCWTLLFFSCFSPSISSSEFELGWKAFVIRSASLMELLFGYIPVWTAIDFELALTCGMGTWRSEVVLTPFDWKKHIYFGNCSER